MWVLSLQGGLLGLWWWMFSLKDQSFITAQLVPACATSSPTQCRMGHMFISMHSNETKIHLQAHITILKIQFPFSLPWDLFIPGKMFLFFHPPLHLLIVLHLSILKIFLYLYSLFSFSLFASTVFILCLITAGPHILTQWVTLMLTIDSKLLVCCVCKSALLYCRSTETQL